MTPPGPDSDPASYVAAVLIRYVELPETPMRASVPDPWQARRLFDRSLPLPVVESAFLLAALRRLVRPADGPPLSPIRSLAYFLPVIDELLVHPAPDNYPGLPASQATPNVRAARHPGRCSEKGVF